jgi:hypothetical protein
MTGGPNLGAAGVAALYGALFAAVALRMISIRGRRWGHGATAFAIGTTAAASSWRP